ncbi:MAG: site-specific integrase [Sulfuricaulis sp.]|nr:site-specific integrase [Sulfuricaulis sp.]
MATIRKKGEYQWHVQIRRKGYDAQTKTLNTRAEAEAWARAVENEMDRGIFVSRAEAESTTLKKALERYQREVTPRKRGAAQEDYRINALLVRPLAKRTLAGCRGAEVAKFRDERLAEGVAPSTIMKDLALLSHLFETARKEWGIEVENPVKKITKPKVDNARERRLSAEEERYLLAALDDPGDAVKVKDGDRRNAWTPKIARFAIETAMRQGEILAMDWRYVDLERCVVHLPETKNGTTRDVPLSSAAVALLRGGSEVVRLRRGKVFPTTASALKQSFARAVARGRRNYLADRKKKGGEPLDEFLVDLTFHDLRHVATERLAERLQMHELMRVTGHKDTRMLARYYHPRAEDMAKKLG